SNERVSLMTLHAAKGLEFGNVFIVGLEDGLLPHERSSTDKDELEEERRLFFVGITRAKEGLYISYSRYRTIHGQMLRAVPSQFLYELGSDFIKTNSNAMQQQSEPSYTIDEIPEFFTGQAVKHEKFGYGRIKEFVDMGQSSIVVVRFNTGQTKKLMVKYANLSKVDIQ
ncbi:MAG: ATP-binding domain-containing protein, partial [Planctomycetes bacterium]|nr:ATP-binding domain-containing protein [Planctomycetota bacterium]